jgi:hypothetical protein
MPFRVSSGGAGLGVRVGLGAGLVRSARMSSRAVGNQPTNNNNKSFHI